jgi:hypothetical protein
MMKELADIEARPVHRLTKIIIRTIISVKSLWLKMAAAGVLAVLAEFLVTYVIMSVLALPLWTLAVGLPLFWLFQWLISPVLISRGARDVTDDPAFSRLRDMVRRIAEASGVRPPGSTSPTTPSPTPSPSATWCRGGAWPSRGRSSTYWTRTSSTPCWPTR